MTLLRVSRPFECRRCREVIATGEAAIVQVVTSRYKWGAYHPGCLLDVSPHNLERALSASVAQPRSTLRGPIASWSLDAVIQPAEIMFEGRTELFEKAKKRVALFNEIADDEKRRRRRKVVEGEAPPPRIEEIARDPKGRPRVSVL